MVPESHDLHHELPEYAERIAALKDANGRFAHLIEAYDEVNRHVLLVETNAELATGLELEDLKKKRLKLKDDLYAMLKEDQAA
ncbi:MAG: DUF465 domain-containing protein [Rhodocyclaceae bacterium]|nr:DUF465 domain-containing protein [Rhodocyclaceae bacterium]